MSDITQSSVNHTKSWLCMVARVSISLATKISDFLFAFTPEIACFFLPLSLFMSLFVSIFHTGSFIHSQSAPQPDWRTLPTAFIHIHVIFFSRCSHRAKPTLVALCFASVNTFHIYKRHFIGGTNVISVFIYTLFVAVCFCYDFYFSTSNILCFH